MLLNLQGWSPGEAELVTCFCNPGQMPFCLPDSFHMQCASFLLSGCWFIGGGDFDGGFCVCCFCLVIFFFLSVLPGSNSLQDQRICKVPSTKGTDLSWKLFVSL